MLQICQEIFLYMETSKFSNSGFSSKNNFGASIFCILLHLEHLIDKSLIGTLLWIFDGPVLAKSAFSRGFYT